MQNAEIDSRLTFHVSRTRFHTLAGRIWAILSRPEWLVLTASLCITLLPVPWVLEAWVPQGDEPHYLLAAHSLVADGDLDLADNYARQDYARFYPGPLGPHLRAGAGGQSVLSHDVGLPILIAPAYALAGRAGVAVFLAVVAALLGVNIYLLAFEVTGKRAAALATWLIFALAPLLSIYAYLIYPETIGALAVLWSTRQIHKLQPPSTQMPDTQAPAITQHATRPTHHVSRFTFHATRFTFHATRFTFHATRFTFHATRFTFPLSLTIIVLPCLSARFIPIALFLAACAAWQLRKERRQVAIVVSALLLSLLAYFAAGAWTSGPGSGVIDIDDETVPIFRRVRRIAAATRQAWWDGPVSLGFQGFSLERVARGLAGWWLDQQRGVLIYAPVYVVALIGLPRLLRRWRWTGALLLAPLLVAWGSAAAWGGFWVGWEVSARYLVIGLPLLAAPLALALAAIRGPIFRGLVFVTVLISLLNTMLILSAPGYVAYRESPVLIYDRGTPLELWRVLPALGGGARLEPDPNTRLAAAVVADGNRSAWRVPAGAGGAVIYSSALSDLTAGAYVLRFDARVLGAPPSATPLLSIDVFSIEGIVLLHHVLTASDFPADGSYASFALPFHSPFYNKWSYPVYAQATASGVAETWLSALAVDVDAGRTWGVIGLWAGLIGIAIAAFNRPTSRSERGA